MADYNEEKAARIAELQKEEDRHERNQMLAGVGAVAAAGLAAFAAYEVGKDPEHKVRNEALAGIAGAAALAAGGYAVSEHIKENKVEKAQEDLGEKKHGWFD